MATRFIDKEYGADTSTAIANDATGRAKVRNLPDAAGLNYDKVDNTFKFNGNDTVKTLADTSSTQTFTNKTLTSPVISGAGSVTGQTVSGNINTDTKVLAATATTTTNVLASLTGFSWSLVAGATYRFDVELATTQTTNGGLTVAFKYTTATLTSIQLKTYQATDTDNTTAISTNNVTTTDATKFIDNKTAAYTRSRLHGTLVVNAAGTVAIQVAQNTTNSDTTSILLGSYATFERVL